MILDDIVEVLNKVPTKPESIDEAMAALDAIRCVVERASRPPGRLAWVPLFLDVLRRTGEVSKAVREAGAKNSNVYAYRSRNAKFRADWDAALCQFAENKRRATSRTTISPAAEQPSLFYLRTA